MGGDAQRGGGEDVAGQRKTREAELCPLQGRPAVKGGRSGV